ncbi:MAG: PD40 domain-containing protein [Acidobacteria bacterium]|nr:PD40 domain-containing protein [Acidobacteriota bacterium]
MTKDPARDILPSWSHDGRWVYFASDRTGTFQTWKMRADGSAPAIQVTRNGGFGGIESADGHFLYYNSLVMSGPIYRVPVDGGEEVLLGNGIRSLRLPRNFAVGRDGIDFMSSDDPSRWFEISVYSFAGRLTEVIARIEGRLGNVMTISPDGQSLLFTVEQHAGDLVMVEDFR